MPGVIFGLLCVAVAGLVRPAGWIALAVPELTNLGGSSKLSSPQAACAPLSLARGIATMWQKDAVPACPGPLTESKVADLRKQEAVSLRQLFS